MTFDDAVRKHFDVDATWEVSSDIENGESWQYSEYTGGTDPGHVVISVRKPGSRVTDSSNYKEEKFDSMPALWEALVK
jgi:hypothetical protein